MITDYMLLDIDSLSDEIGLMGPSNRRMLMMELAEYYENNQPNQNLGDLIAKIIGIKMIDTEELDILFKNFVDYGTMHPTEISDMFFAIRKIVSNLDLSVTPIVEGIPNEE